MKKLALILAAGAALAAPATAPAVERPEWNDCRITSAPKRIPMAKALSRGIPIAYTCETGVNVLIPLRFDDRRINGWLTPNESLTAIGAVPPRDVAAGETVETTVRIANGWPRRVLKRVTRARVMIDVAVRRHGVKSGHFSHPRNARYVTLVR